MYEFMEKRKRVAQIILALLILPFAFFGLESYFQGGGREVRVAEVAGEPVTEREYQSRLREQQDRMREALGAQARPEMFDSAEFRAAVVEGIVQERLLVGAAQRAGLRVTDAQLQQVIAGQPEFQENGQFSMRRYQTVLQRAGMSELSYQERMRTELALAQVQLGFTAGTIVPASVVDRIARAIDPQREVSRIEISADAFLKQVQLEAEAPRRFYDANRREFEIPEQVRVEYLSLSQAEVSSALKFSERELREHFEQNGSQFRAAEERQAAHILLRYPPGADDKAKAAVRERAGQLAAQLRKAPEGFPEAARKSSEDTGSAARGGDLGFVVRGALPRPFEDALFALKPGEIAGPVETESGVHVVRLVAVRGGGGASFEALRPKIEEDLRRARATRRHAELAEAFTNLVFEQSDSLKAAADAIGQPVRTSGWFSRQGGDTPRGANDRLVAAIFADEVLREQRNTAAVETGPGVLMAARVVESKPASVRPFEEVASAIERRLRLARASELAVEAGRKRLEALRTGGADPGGWSTPATVSRREPGSLPQVALRPVFREDVSRLPAYTGVEQPGGGYLLLRIGRVVETRGVDPQARATVSRQVQQAVAQEQVATYLEGLRKAASVRIERESLERR
jgi:peptidyl-prolyl cis-trans isomerase D